MTNRVLPAVAAVLMLAACGSHEPGSEQGHTQTAGWSESISPTGKMHGTVVLTGGPAGASPVVDRDGTVVVTKGGDRAATQHVSADGQFAFALPVGTYRLSVADTGAPCQETDVTITGGSDKAVQIICPRK